MTRPDVLRIDDVLLRAASILGVLWAVGASIALAVSLGGAEPGVGGLGRGAWLALLATAPLGLLVAGLRLRRRENRAIALLKLVDEHVEIPAADLLRDSDLTRETLDRAIRDLNNAGIAFLVWDRETGVVQDGRLRTTRVHVDECGACGAKVSVALPLGRAGSARCPYCHDPLGAERLIEERARLVDALDGEVSQRRARAVAEGRRFSIPLFIVLSLVFWPLGLAYAFWHWQASGAPR